MDRRQSDERWVALTDEDRQAAFASLPDMLDGFLKTWGWLHFAKAIEDRCREKNAALIAENARLREALRLIATPGYGIELGDTDDVRAEYWSEQTEKCRCIARAALAEREAARQFYESCEAEARQIVRTA